MQAALLFANRLLPVALFARRALYFVLHLATAFLNASRRLIRWFVFGSVAGGFPAPGEGVIWGAGAGEGVTWGAGAGEGVTWGEGAGEGVTWGAGAGEGRTTVNA